MTGQRTNGPGACSAAIAESDCGPTALSLRTTLSWHADSTSSSSRLASLMNLLSFRAGLEREATIEVPMETCSGLAIGRLVVGDLIEAHLLRQAAASCNISRSQLWETLT